MLTRAFERAVPKTLWTINRRLDRCIAPQRVKVFAKRAKVTPDIGCTIVCTATRGPLRLHSKGNRIVTALPPPSRKAALPLCAAPQGTPAPGAPSAHAQVTLHLTPGLAPRTPP